jgi:cyclopropane-fatty-acyl-phospholipid synthase
VISSYDQSNELFSKEMMYSCALWSEAGGVCGDLEMGPIPGDLEAAQGRKIYHVLNAAHVKPGDRVLEFGSGLGGLAIEVLIDKITVKLNHFDRPRVTMVAKSIP